MAKQDKELKDTLSMTADTIGKDLLSALVQEIRLLTDVWEKLSQAKQDDPSDFHSGDDAIEGEVLGLPEFSTEQLQEAYEAGFKAYQENSLKTNALTLSLS